MKKENTNKPYCFPVNINKLVRNNMKKRVLYKDRIDNFKEFLKTNNLSFLINENIIQEQLKTRHFPIIEMEHATHYNMLLVQAMSHNSYYATIQNYLARE